MEGGEAGLGRADAPDGVIRRDLDIIGGPDGRFTLEAAGLLPADLEHAGVIEAPDRPVGRGHDLAFEMGPLPLAPDEHVPVLGLIREDPVTIADDPQDSRLDFLGHESCWESGRVAAVLRRR